MATPLPSSLDTVAATVAGYIAAHPDLAAGEGRPAIDALVEDKADLGRLVLAKLNALGIAVVVIVTEVTPGPRADATRRLGRARIVVEVSEIPLTNKTGRNCRTVAERVWAAVDGKPNGLPAIARQPDRSAVVLEDGPNLRLIPDRTGKIIRHVTFETSIIL